MDNSGYGEFGNIDRDRFEPIVKLRGWTRGLSIDDGVAFVGTSRVVPRFRHYAPGVDPDTSEAGVHAIDLQSGRVLGSLVWPIGNQIFAIEISKRFRDAGFPLSGTGRPNAQVRQLYFRGSPFDLKTTSGFEYPGRGLGRAARRRPGATRTTEHASRRGAAFGRPTPSLSSPTVAFWPGVTMPGAISMGCHQGGEAIIALDLNRS